MRKGRVSSLLPAPGFLTHVTMPAPSESTDSRLAYRLPLVSVSPAQQETPHMGKPKHSDDDRGEQKGAQEHAQGQHGAATRAQLKQQINNNGASAAEQAAAAEDAQAVETRQGKHKIYEGRKQHDEADKNAEKNRLMRDIDRFDLDREQFQVRGGRETHPALPPDGPDETIKSPGQGG